MLYLCPVRTVFTVHSTYCCCYMSCMYSTVQHSTAQQARTPASLTKKRPQPDDTVLCCAVLYYTYCTVQSTHTQTLSTVSRGDIDGPRGQGVPLHSPPVTGMRVYIHTYRVPLYVYIVSKYSTIPTKPHLPPATTKACSHQHGHAHPPAHPPARHHNARV